MVEKAEVDLQKRVAETQDWFREAHKELKAAQGELAKHDVELTMKLADIEKAQETARNLAAAAEAARTQHEAALNSQEEDLAAGELSEANNSIKDLKLKLEGLEKVLSEAKPERGPWPRSWRPRSSCGRTRASTLRITWRARTVGSIASPPSPTRPPRSWPSWGCRT